MGRRIVAVLGFASPFAFGGSSVFAQTYSLDTSCTMDTSIEKEGGSLGSAVKDCTDGGSIASGDDGTNFPFFEKETSAAIARSSDKVVITARARSASTFTSRPDPRITVNSHAQITVRVHAFPLNQNYLVQVDGTVLAEWNRAGSSGLGSAGAGISIVNCPGKVITVGTGGTPSGSQTKTESVRCVINIGNAGGLLTEVGASVSAQAVAQDGTANEHAAQMSYTVLVKRAGDEMRPLAGAQQTVAGSSLPEDVQVLVVQNDTDAPIQGRTVEFRLKDAGGAVLDTFTRTTLADGKAAANFIIPAGGSFTVEAVCASCVVGQTLAFPVTALAGELAALPGPREGPVGGTVELTFKATEKVIVGGVVQENPFSGTPVSFTASGPAGDAAFSPNPATTGQDGVARVQFTLGSAPGTYAVTATCGACRANQIVALGVTASRPTVQLRRVAGDTSGAAGRLLDNQLVVQAWNQAAQRGAEGLGVTFSITDAPPGGSDASVVLLDARTDAAGLAEASVRLGSSEGDYEVTALCPACDAANRVVFAISAVSPSLETHSAGESPRAQYPSPTGQPLEVAQLSTEFQTPAMLLNGRSKVVDNAVANGIPKQRVGVLVGDAIWFKAVPKPDAEFPPADFRWESGTEPTGNGTGSLLKVTFNSSGDHALAVRLRDKAQTAHVRAVEIPEGKAWKEYLSSKEVKPLQYVRIYQYAVAASIFVARDYRRDHNGRGDALRHAYWSALMASDPLLGAEFADRTTEAYERGNLAANEPHNEAVMDTENNRVGAAIGGGRPGASRDELKSAVQQAADSGGLLVLDDILNPHGAGLLERTKWP